ncbi:hypothetical protein LTSEINV_2823 [Salmonella enterica subsp. enterica serovar Inverness str. R8-3668]|uniref:Uncharacterized protein n=1 Tax=Salmonella enterica subsp. enterica serovar Inverness str. R8-3668 TaxID=913075 RepID=G5NDT5_SALET|nr:hypothetical protein LTSEINV_2823 [Salmonella enterica subsp. enterica serovar Inverness str. R8-3668]ESH24040.1 hypothetical protein SEEGA711_00015 [Salmonella enterica subsp. enterica serovar Gaminara str. ATCC BAA-711]
MVVPVVMVVPVEMVEMVDRVEKAEVVGYGIKSSHEYYKKSGSVITIFSSGFFLDASC